VKGKGKIDAMINRKSMYYWNRERVLQELKLYCEMLGRFPARSELLILGHHDLLNAIYRYGGGESLSQELGVKMVAHAPNYWTWERLKERLKPLCEKFGRFPTAKDLRDSGNLTLSNFIQKFGGYRKVCKRMGYKPNRMPNGYWTEKRMERALKRLNDKYGHFPTPKEFRKEKKTSLSRAIAKKGGVNARAKAVQAVPIKKPTGYWTWPRVLDALKPLCDQLGRFPTRKECDKAGLCAPYCAMGKMGGSYAAAEKLGVKVVKMPQSYWNLDRLIEALLPIAEKIGRFPTKEDLRRENRISLTNFIDRYGGTVDVAMAISRRVEEGKLEGKWYFASRLSPGAFSRLPKEMQAELARKDDYYKRIWKGQETIAPLAFRAF